MTDDPAFCALPIQGDTEQYAIARFATPDEPLWLLSPKVDWVKAAQAAHWLSALTPHAARDLLGWAHADGGWMTGGFTTKLLDTCANADEEHLDRLALGYPAEVAAYRIWTRINGSPELLKAYAESEKP